MKINARGPLFQSSNLAPLNPWFITGFTDGEGSWGLSIIKDSTRTTGFNIIPKFTIGLHAKDVNLLERIAAQFGVGTKHDEETITKISKSLKGIGGIKVWVTNTETKESTQYASLVEAAKALGVKSHHTIKKYLESGELLLKKYFISVNGDMPLPQNNNRKSNNSVSIPITVTNVKTGETLDYISIYEAIRDLGISGPTLKSYLVSGKCLKDTYILKWKPN